MSVLEKIRSRTGLLVGIVGLALGIFILESLLGSGSSLFRSNDNVAAVIAGEKIEAQEFQSKVQEQINKVLKRTSATRTSASTSKRISRSWSLYGIK